MRYFVCFGYIARWQDWFSDEAVDGLMKFAQGFAIPMLLFRAISTLDLVPRGAYSRATPQ